MPYVISYYNYQIAVIFAILLAALLILGGLFVALYMAFIKKKDPEAGKKLYTSGEQMGYDNIDKEQQRQWQSNAMIQSPFSNASNIQQSTIDQLNIAPRTPTQISYPLSPAQTYQNQPLVQVYRPEGAYNAQIRDVQPDMAFQQGPVSWTTMAPASSTQPVVPPQSAYQMSAV
uniref:Secreted protein n=1 Tax=Strongyloides papillosus TaxID=174720 RepID=A0A0N5BPQ0_STREA